MKELAESHFSFVLPSQKAKRKLNVYAANSIFEIRNACIPFRKLRNEVCSCKTALPLITQGRMSIFNPFLVCSKE